MDLKHLVSGTDIRGIVSEVEGKKVTLTEKEVDRKSIWKLDYKKIRKKI